MARVVASTPERSAAAADRLDALAPAATAEELIDSDDVHVVHICTPNSLHAPLAHRTLAAGKPVVCEKPLATTLSDARSLAAAAGDRVATVPFVYRFYPAVREAGRVAAGEAGPLHLLHGAYLQDWQAGGAAAGWRGEAGEGGAYRAFADIGVHWCDLVEFTTGHRIVRLLARTAGGGTVTTVLFTDAGASGSMLVSQTAIGRRNALRFSLDGVDASYGFDQEYPESLLVGGLDGNLALHRGSPATSRRRRVTRCSRLGTRTATRTASTLSSATPTARSAGPPRMGCPFADGARAVALVDAVISSSESSTWVEVPS